MMKIYIKPETTVYEVNINANLMLGSIDEEEATKPAEGRGFFFEPEEIETEE